MSLSVSREGIGGNGVFGGFAKNATFCDAKLSISLWEWVFTVSAAHNALTREANPGCRFCAAYYCMGYSILGALGILAFVAVILGAMAIRSGVPFRIRIQLGSLKMEFGAGGKP